MKLIDADALYIDIVAKGQASKRYKIGETWELTGAEIREVIDAQPALKQEHKWISCNDELPEEYDDVAIDLGCNQIGYGYYDGEFWNVCYGDFEFSASSDEVRGWYPLPKLV